MSARAAYDRFAEHYDAYIAGVDFAGWTANLEALARRAGLRGRRLLDVACGTGGSFVPFLERGWTVTACDISPRMAAIAAEKAAGRAEIHVCDMREMPRLGEFDLATCLNDSLNYVGEPEELAAAIRGIALNLAPGGVLVADVNSLATLRSVFGGLNVLAGDDRVMVWRGTEAAREATAGELVRAELEILLRGDGGWTTTTSLHVQRHHDEPAIRRAIAAAGLRLAGVHGMPPGIAVHDDFDELRDAKAVYVAVKF